MSRPAPDTVEQVVLLDEDGTACGTTDKAGVHHARTPLHLAFSCYLFDATGTRFLLTQRALHKRTFPGVWTNSCCGHPAPGEGLSEAVTRRLRQELGLEVTGLRLLLPGFRYRAEMDGVVENEMCPVYVGVVAGTPDPDPEEVETAAWVDWDEFRSAVLAGHREVSVWCREQVRALPARPLDAPTRPDDELPPAARPGLGAAG